MSSNPTPDLELVSTDDLFLEINKRFAHVVLFADAPSKTGACGELTMWTHLGDRSAAIGLVYRGLHRMERFDEQCDRPSEDLDDDEGEGDEG